MFDYQALCKETISAKSESSYLLTVIQIQIQFYLIG